MISAVQLRAARALAGIDQRQLAEKSGLSVPTIQRMEASEGVIRGNVDSLMRVIGALDKAGVELIGEDAPSTKGGRGVRLKESRTTKSVSEKPRARERPSRRLTASPRT